MSVQYFCSYFVVEKKSTNFQCGEGGLVLLTALLCRTVVKKWFILFSVLCYSGEPENVPLNPNSDLSISSTYLNIFNKSKFSTTCSHRLWCNCLVGAIIGCGAVTECVAIIVWCCHRVCCNHGVVLSPGGVAFLVAQSCISSVIEKHQQQFGILYSGYRHVCVFY